MSQDTIKIEIDSIDYRFLKASYDKVITHQEQKEKVDKSYLLHECEESDVKVAELVYLGAVNDFIRQIQDTFGILVDTDLSLLVEDESEAPAEPAPEESESSADNISSNDASNNDISSNDVLAEDVQEFPFPEVLETNQNDSIKERFVLLSLKDAEIEDLAGMCGVCGIPTNCMLESFVADLVGSENRNSIESMILARRWFDSTLFGQTYVCLLGFLLKEGYDPYDDLIRYLEDIKQGEYDLLDYDVNPLASEIDPEDIGYLREDLENWKEHVNKLRNEFQKTYRDAKWDEEVKYVIQWWEDKELFKTRFDKFVNNEFDK